MNHLLKPRILCIDDEPSVGELLRAMLEGTGDFIVKVETSAMTAVNRARMFRPDLIFIDINMPVMDGFALARAIRLEPGLCHRPIVFFSGCSNVEISLRKAERSGPTEFLQKGASLSIIEQTVRRILSERIKQYEACKPAQG